MNHSSRNARYAVLIILALVLAACSDNVLSPELSGATESSASVTAPQPTAQVASTAASGTVVQTEILTLDVRNVGQNTILDQTSRGIIDGTLTGTFEDELTVKIRPNGTFVTKFTITCACAVDGKEGVLTITAVDRGELVNPDLATFSGHALIKEGTGELAGLRGVLKIEGSVDVASGLSDYTYQGTVRWLPQ